MRLFFVTHQISTHSLFAECRKLRTLGKASRSLHVNVRENKTFSKCKETAYTLVMRQGRCTSMYVRIKPDP